MKTLNDYVLFRTDPSNDHVTDGIWCAEDIRIELLEKWKMDNPTIMLSILEKRRGLYASELIKIDQALLAKARSGDPRSIELCWAKYENWTTKTEEASVKAAGGRHKTLTDLMQEM